MGIAKQDVKSAGASPRPRHSEASKRGEAIHTLWAREWIKAHRLWAGSFRHLTKSSSGSEPTHISRRIVRMPGTT